MNLEDLYHVNIRKNRKPAYLLKKGEKFVYGGEIPMFICLEDYPEIMYQTISNHKAGYTSVRLSPLTSLATYE
jgi:hypothetical protein